MADYLKSNNENICYDSTSDKDSETTKFSSNIDVIRLEISKRCDSLIDKINNRRKTLSYKLNELEVYYEENYALKNEEYNNLMKVRESLDTIYKNNTNCEAYRAQVRLVDSQIDKLSEGVDKLLSFRWNVDTEQKLSHLGELDLVVYDYLSKVQPVICTGDAGTSPGNLNWPRGLDIDPKSSNIYIANYKNNRIEVFSRQGNFLFNFGGGDSVFQVQCPHSICITNDKLYLLEGRTEGRVICFKLDGTFIKMCPKVFNGAGRISCVPNGSLFFITAEQTKISLLNDNLDFIGLFKPQALNTPVDLKVFDDEVFILDKGDPCMHVFGLDGNHRRNIPISRGPAGSGKNVINPQNFAIDPFGRFIICASNSHCVMIFSRKGHLVHKIGKEGNNIGEFKFPNSLCLDPLARIITVCERSNNGLQIY